MAYEDFDDGYVQTSLGRIHFKKSTGSGKKVIFLHGFGSNARSFHKLAELLPEGVIEAYFIDLLGHGDSEAPEMTYTIDKQVQVVREFIKKTGAEDSYLFGASYGGWIAALIAQGGYEGLGIILEDAVGLKEYFDEVSKRFSPDEYREKALNEVRFLNPREQVADSILRSNTPDLYLTRESLAKISKPALVVWGEKDTIVEIKYGKMLVEYINGSKLEVVIDSGHVPHYTDPEKVRDILVRFISS
jgi:pimeloyl-ACP methyl ester carboxylesterase